MYILIIRIYIYVNIFNTNLARSSYKSIMIIFFFPVKIISHAYPSTSISHKRNFNRLRAIRSTSTDDHERPYTSNC